VLAGVVNRAVGLDDGEPDTVGVAPGLAVPVDAEDDGWAVVAGAVSDGAGVDGSGTGAVSLYRLRMVWLPVCASPAGIAIHGGGVIAIPLWPPLLPV
jgi:hypothetical protein